MAKPDADKAITPLGTPCLGGAAAPAEQPAPSLARRGIAKLDDICFWALFSLGVALVSPPLATLAALLGMALLLTGWILTGHAVSPDAPDDVDFTRFFLGVTALVYAVAAATQWTVGLWALMLSGMFLLHCARNLMIVEKLLVLPASAPPIVETRDGQVILDDVRTMLENVLEARPEAQSEPVRLAAERVKAVARRHFVLRQRGALHLQDATLRDLPALEREIERAKSAREKAGSAEQREAREREAKSLERLLIAAERPPEAVARFRATMAACEEALADIDDKRVERDKVTAGEGSADLPVWLALALSVLEATLDRAEEDLTALEAREKS